MVDGPEFLIGEMRVQTTREEIFFCPLQRARKTRHVRSAGVNYGCLT